MAARAWLVHLSPATCEELLGAAVIGRLGVIVEGQPRVFPVQYVYVDGAVLFPTNEGTKMRAALAWPAVAFEIDGIEPDGSSGWSVMVHGTATEVTDPAEIRRATASSTIQLHTGEGAHWVRIVPTEITGRRIHATPRPAA